MSPQLPPPFFFKIRAVIQIALRRYGGTIPGDMTWNLPLMLEKLNRCPTSRYGEAQNYMYE